MQTRFFRAGVGTVIYNQQGQVALFERAQNPVGVWQFQQGGIDLGEKAEDTLWRELKEEIGLESDHIRTVTPFPHWTIHHEAPAQADANKSRLGQVHSWFFLELKPGHAIDLAQATEYEASAWCWTTFPEAIATTEPTKQPVYQQLYEFFQREIQK